MDSLKAIKRNAIKKWQQIIKLANEGQLEEAYDRLSDPCAFCATAFSCRECHVAVTLGEPCTRLPEWEQHRATTDTAWGDPDNLERAIVDMALWAIETIKTL